jgi:23S rRNA (cytosine1962-C5)-methyltransferase
VSVDLAAGPLAWARANFRLSGLDPEDPRFRFEPADAFRWFDAAVAKGAIFDVVILDPPTVSGARASQWSQKRDYPDLVALAARLLPETGGHLWASSNAWRGKSVLAQVEEGLAKAGRRGLVLESGGLPPDYPTPLSWPQGRYLEVLQLRVA